MQPARPVAPLVRELTTAGAGFAAAGVVGLAAAIVVIDAPIRALALWATSAAVVGAAMALRAGWIDAAPAGPCPAGTRVESRRDTLQRHAVVMAPALVAVAVCLPLATGLGALIAGMVAGTGAGDLRGARVARRREDRERTTLVRELGGHPFAGPRRPLYILERSASTFRT